ncbi:hypothetical protein VPH35_051993 [Triticum aestivum]|uniref:uncharacterized protein n=1 Tax=Triticum aestivum TaxID=4565 RepID=UPI000E7B4BB3|nr:uncharacterized protein LOC123069956 [Triticum aestivum]
MPPPRNGRRRRPRSWIQGHPDEARGLICPLPSFSVLFLQGAPPQPPCSPVGACVQRAVCGAGSALPHAVRAVSTCSPVGACVQRAECRRRISTGTCSLCRAREPGPSGAVRCLRNMQLASSLHAVPAARESSTRPRPYPSGAARCCCPCSLLLYSTTMATEAWSPLD